MLSFCRLSLLFLTLVAISCILPPARVRAAPPALQVLARTGGQPDDIIVDGQGRLVWGNLASGTLERLVGGSVVTVARDLSVPEGLVALPDGSLVVAEQGRDRIVRVRNGVRTVLLALRPVYGQEGVDGIGLDRRTGDLLIPDSPRGDVYRAGRDGRNRRLIAHGLGRPVDAAVDAHGNVLVPDEHLGTLLVVSPSGALHSLGRYSTPDDVAVDGHGTIWVTSLGDGGLWSISPGGSPREVLTGLASPQGLTLDRCGDPIVVEQNSARIVRVLLRSTSRTCPL